MGVRNLQVYVDSKLVSSQINGEYEARDANMKKYMEKAKELISSFNNFDIQQVPRSENKKADALSKLASVAFAHLTKKVLVEVLERPSIDEQEVLAIVEEHENTWMTPIIQYLVDGTLPQDPSQARKVRVKAPNYNYTNGILYKRSYLVPWLRCIGPQQAEYVIREVHEGACGMHSGPRSVVAKVMNMGYFWPSMHRDALTIIQKCNSCQVNAPISRQPQTDMISVTAPWPFQKWAMDIVGPFPIAQGQLKFLIVAIDYFTKWVEAKPVKAITGAAVKKFVWENIVCRYGLPHEIVTDNGAQFAGGSFKSWCAELKINQIFTSVAHPQANGQVERANRSIVEGIKLRLEGQGSDWLDNLSHVLWAHRTMVKTSHGETPFSLTYGTEAVLPAEIGVPTWRTANPEENGGQDLRLNLDLLEERREIAAIRECRNKQQMAKYYNSRVKPTSFVPGDYVLRKNEASRAQPEGKLGPKWEGPYQVVASHGNGSYELAKSDGTSLPRSWNVANLRKCYL